MERNNNNNNDDNVQYKGVRKRKWGKWVSEIRLPNSRERIWLGSYDTQEKAARAFDAALYCLRGEDAKFNFPNNPPHIPDRSSLTRPQIQATAAKYANEEPPPPPPPPPSSSSSPSPHEYFNNTSMDWEFFDMMTPSGSGGSDFSVFYGMNDFPGEFLPPQTEMDYSEENESVFVQQSFLWNF